MFALKGPVMKADTAHFAPAFPLKHAQKDMKLALLLADGIGKKIYRIHNISVRVSKCE